MLLVGRSTPLVARKMRALGIMGNRVFHGEGTATRSMQTNADPSDWTLLGATTL